MNLMSAVQIVGDALGRTSATYCFGGRFQFVLDAGWSLAISPDDAGRFRLEAVYGDRARATMWCLAADHRRLAELVLSAKREAAALAA